MHLFAPPPCELHFLHLRILITAAITFVLQCSYCAATTEHNTMQYNTMEYTAVQYATTEHNTIHLTDLTSFRVIIRLQVRTH